MKTKITAILGIMLRVFAIAITVALIHPATSYAADASTPSASEAAVITDTVAAPDAVIVSQANAEEIESIVQLLPESVRGIIEPYLAKIPGIVFSILSIYGTLSLLWQAVNAWWHKRIAETTTDDDNQWTDKLAKAWWFRVLDKAFYFGGYIGAWKGGKKL